MKIIHYTTFKAPITGATWVDNKSLAIRNKDGPAGTMAFGSTEEANKFIMNNLTFESDVTVIENEGLPTQRRVNAVYMGPDRTLVAMPLIPAYWHQPIPLYTLETLPHKLASMAKKELNYA